jgi:hypothetical protein
MQNESRAQTIVGCEYAEATGMPNDTKLTLRQIFAQELHNSVLRIRDFIV